ncbi:MAG: ABC transporter substrate-binding protein [Candidatus Omnitrophica bacterium CG11_big_fil_rev_8_21_14_0_20_42_13]|uniref:ABC transporter substrate-binding protein n=1 Tax=Candidatus Ghiorseimicrobium undicola TaxID=1974746 RepID=A0A2H0LVN1_9BACT|nr:MAG: ABC transporter substrate-binding protein [Candidatus Omnitrophica bacterium CG11_big_fil_rev_8_21_14_0_20_42_13]
MFTYIIRRILIAVPLIIGMSLVTFFIINMASGNYFDTMKMDPQVSAATIAKYEALYGLDKPVFMQYLYWLKNLLRFDFGYSFFYNAPVRTIIMRRLFNTFILSLSSLIFSWLIAIPLGIYSAVHYGSLKDRAVSFVSFIGISIPSFFLALLLLNLASLGNFLPLGGMRSANFDSLNFMRKTWDIARHLIIPTVVISVGGIAGLQRITRANLLDVLRQQYITFARAKGLPEGRVVYHHALRNAVNPLVTIFGYNFSGLLSGAALIEIICAWPGLGSVMFTAVRSGDNYLVMGSFLMSSALLLFGNLLADIILAKVDPRIRHA